MQLWEIVHKRHRIVRDRYGHRVAVATHIGEGAYFASFAFGLSHEFIGPLYVGLFVVWCCHTVIVGFEGE